MTGSLDLLKKALEVKSAAAWARDLNVTRATLTMAKTRGRLSPVLAGNFAIELGEPAEKWIAIAAIEQEENTPLLMRLRNSQPQWRKLSLSDNRRDDESLPERRRRGFLNAVNRAFYDAGRTIKHYGKVSEAVKALAI